MPKCSVISCPNNTRHVRKKDGVSYFSFPRNPIRCSEWAVIIGKARNEIYYKPSKGSVVCSNHFPASDIYTTTKGFSRLNKNAKPILHLSKKQIRSYDNSDQNSNQQTIKQNDDSTESYFDENSSREIEPSPSTSLSVESILETPREMFIKKKLNSCEKIIQNKNRQINRLRKQNKRLIKNNKILKNAFNLLKSRKGIEEMYRKKNLSKRQCNSRLTIQF